MSRSDQDPAYTTDPLRFLPWPGTDPVEDGDTGDLPWPGDEDDVGVPLEPLPTGSVADIASFLTDGYWEAGGETGRQFETDEGNTAAHVITVDMTALDNQSQRLARWALETWELVANIQFVETEFSGDITIFDTDDNDTPDAFAQNFTSGVDDGTGEIVGGGTILSSEVTVDEDWVDEFGNTLDSYTFTTFVHELGHALGLGHPGAYNGNAGVQNYFNDSWQMSVMSYFPQGSRDTDEDDNPDVDASYALPTGPMMADIFAIQSMYGDSTVTAGDTTWGQYATLSRHFSTLFAGSEDDDIEPIAFTLFDGAEGGTDTIDLRPSTTDDFLNLNAGNFSDIGGLSGNLGIAEGSEFEIALMGSGRDTVWGNGLDNELNGNGGRDRLYGSGGEDLLKGGGGRDKLYGGGGEDTLRGGGGRDRLEGGANDDLLIGGRGNDRFESGEGNDRMVGGSGKDRFFYGFGHDEDTISDFTLGEDRLVFDAVDFEGLAAEEMIAAYARVTSQGVMFDFGIAEVLGADYNDRLLLTGVFDTEALVDDILILG